MSKEYCILFAIEMIRGEVRFMSLYEPIKNARELEFAVFCVENVAARLGVKAELVYKAFTEKSDILHGYIVPEYEILHTQGKEYIVNDLLELMQEKGVTVCFDGRE